LIDGCVAFPAPMEFRKCLQSSTWKFQKLKKNMRLEKILITTAVSKTLNAFFLKPGLLKMVAIAGIKIKSKFSRSSMFCFTKDL
jgi:hypothetical protein